MKRKHYATLIIVVILASVSAGVVQFSNGLGTNRPARPSMIKPGHQVSVSVPENRSIKEMKRLEKIMPLLTNPSGSNSAGAQLGLFGDYTFGGKAVRTAGSNASSSSQTDYSLSLAFYCNENRFCVIDDKFYAEGATLPDGWEIVLVELDRVLIKNKNLSKWITFDYQKGMINNTEQSGDTM